MSSSSFWRVELREQAGELGREQDGGRMVEGGRYIEIKIEAEVVSVICCSECRGWEADE